MCTPAEYYDHMLSLYYPSLTCNKYNPIKLIGYLGSSKFNTSACILHIESDFCYTPIYKQFNTCDITTVIRCKK